MVVNIPFLTVMGLAAAGAVIIAVLIATTLLPALLGFLGKRVTRVNRVLALPAARPQGRAREGERALRALRHPPAAGRGARGPGGPAVRSAVPATHMKLGLPDGGSKPTDNTERKAYDLLSEGFGPGFNGVLTVVVDAPEPTKEQQEQIAHEAITGTWRSSRTWPRSRRRRRTRRAT